MPADKDKAINSALKSLIGFIASEDCLNNVIHKLTKNKATRDFTLSNGSVGDSGYVSTQVLREGIESGLSQDRAIQAMGRHPDNLAIAVGRAGGHEAAHYFLQLHGHVSEGLMQESFSGKQWFGPAYNSTFEFTKAQKAQLSKLCP